MIERIVAGYLEVNCYIVWCEKTKDAAIVDPGADYEKIKAELEKLDLKPGCIINTHGHIDHIGADKSFQLPVWIHSLDADFLKDSDLNLSTFFGKESAFPKPARLLNDKDVLNIGEVSLEVIHTPGHTPGSISLKGEGFILTGDTLFRGSVGRTDFPYGSGKKLIESIKERLMVFGNDTVIYPGHGEVSTIGEERRSNPYISS